MLRAHCGSLLRLSDGLKPVTLGVVSPCATASVQTDGAVSAAAPGLAGDIAHVVGNRVLRSLRGSAWPHDAARAAYNTIASEALKREHAPWMGLIT